MSAQEPFAYDRVHYPAHPYHVTRPDHLETMARLFGLRPRPAPEARLLEIGCGTGENLLLAAECFPGARFTGIDLSASQIEVGQRTLAALGLRNAELRAFDLTEIDASFGELDYIVAHGVYSWVPGPVREALLEVIRQRLAPHGVAFVSHNVQPGYHAKALARGMMLYGTRGLVDPAERVAAARSFLGHVTANANPADRLYRATVAERLRQTAEQDDDVLFHDDLSDVCDGSWFWELAERLAAHGLQFLADAATENLGSTGLTPEALGAVNAMAQTVVEREQHLDLLRNRTLRLTLVCPAAAPLEREVGPGQLEALHLGLHPGVIEIGLGEGTDAPLIARTTSTRMQVNDPLTKAALVTLGQAWPGSLPFPEVVARALAGRETPALMEGLGVRLLDLFRGGFVALSPRPPTFALEAPERPRACGLARLQAETLSEVVNLRHTRSQLEDGDRRVLRACDGTRDRAALAAELDLEATAVDGALARLAELALIQAG